MLSRVENLVFAGGGCRCFWQAGFCKVVLPRLEKPVRQVAAASAGAAFACVSLTGRGDEALSNFKKKAARNPSNIHWKKLRTGERIFPHAELFRETVLEILDKEALEKLRQGPRFCVSLTRFSKSERGQSLRVLAGFGAYLLEGKYRDTIHRQWPKKLGLEVEWARIDQCNNVEELADLLLQTACTPPFTPKMRRDGRALFDGGLVDNVPVAAIDKGSSEGQTRRVDTLILLSRHREGPLHRGSCLYLSPSSPLTVKKWDYTDPEGISEAYKLGVRDGESFLREHAGA